MVKDNKPNNAKFKGYKGSLGLKDNVVSYTADEIDLGIPLQSIQSISYIKQDKKVFFHLLSFTLSSFTLFALTVFLATIFHAKPIPIELYVYTIKWVVVSYVAFVALSLYTTYKIYTSYASKLLDNELHINTANNTYVFKEKDELCLKDIYKTTKKEFNN